MNTYFYVASKIYKCVENDKSYTYLIPVPGLTKEDINLEINKGVLKVSITKTPDFGYKLDRLIELPENTNFKSTNAKVENGLLTIVIDKSVEDTFKINVG